MTIEKDILINENWELQILNGDFAVGQSLTQEVAIILNLSQGDLKMDPILGANLIELINAEANQNEMMNRAKLHLKRDAKEWNDIKNKIQMTSKLL